MEFDFAIVYWGLTRSTKKVFESHSQHIFNVLEKNGKTYKKFMHTWSIIGNKQRVHSELSQKEIDYEEYKLLNIDCYRLESQDEFLNSIDMSEYFYEDVFQSKGHCTHGEWLPDLVKNHICALESMKRSFTMVEEDMSKGNRFKFVMFVRPDSFIQNQLPLDTILPFPDKIHLPNFYHYEGYNDRFAITNVANASIYGKRIDEIAEFRKTKGRIVSEKYLKYILDKYALNVNKIAFKFDLVRP